MPYERDQVQSHPVTSNVKSTSLLFARGELSRIGEGEL